jgi:hypothetical protein
MPARTRAAAVQWRILLSAPVGMRERHIHRRYRSRHYNRRCFHKRCYTHKVVEPVDRKWCLLADFDVGQVVVPDGLGRLALVEEQEISLNPSFSRPAAKR